eukprot:8073938-Alexandrium_andersonii.AAC.1
MPPSPPRAARTSAADTMCRCVLYSMSSIHRLQHSSRSVVRHVCTSCAGPSSIPRVGRASRARIRTR